MRAALTGSANGLKRISQVFTGPCNNRTGVAAVLLIRSSLGPKKDICEAKMDVGDVVVLASGGPQMTVSRTKIVPRKGTVQCTWFAGNKKSMAIFCLAELKLVVPKAKGEVGSLS
jgi:uncharacterized protein YodC (DUF2158 family)